MTKNMRRYLARIFVAVVTACTATIAPVVIAGPAAWPLSLGAAILGSALIVMGVRRAFVVPVLKLRDTLRPHAPDADVPTVELARLAASTYRAATEELVRLTSRERNREVALTHASDGVLVLDRHDLIEYANPSARALLHERLIDATRQVTSPGLLRLVERARQTGGAVSDEVILHLPTPTTVLARAVPLADGGATLLLTDLTEARRVDEVRRDFVANVSHELKTPAAGIRALAEVANSALGEGEVDVASGFVQRMQTEAERLGKLVTDLLDLSRVEAGGELELSATDLGSLVTDTADRVRPLAEAKGLRLEVHARGLVVEADAPQLRMAVHNVVENAIRYSEEGTVRVSVEDRPDHVAVVVSDEGLGIPSDDIPRVFERFYRVDKARSRERGGTGLGLSIVRHIVENHGGSVEVQSELGSGSVFTILLPRGVEESSQDEVA